MFKLAIRTPYEDIFNGEVESIYLTAEDGDMELFENHASVTASLLFSPIEIDLGDRRENYLVRNGIFLFDNEKNEAVLMTGYCEKQSEVDFETIEKYAKYIEQQLAEGKDLSEFQIKFLKGEKLAVEQQIEVIK